MQVWNVLRAARCKCRTQKLPKIRQLGSIAQICRAISSQLRHISTVGETLLNSNAPHMTSQYGELRPTSGWYLLASLGHPCKFQRVSRLGSVTARDSSSGRQPNFAALNRGRHLYSAGRPSRWALAHISSSFLLFSSHRSQIGCLRYFHTWCGLSVNLEFRMHVWNVLHAARRKYRTQNYPKIAICAPSYNTTHIHSEPWKRDILFLTITLANLNRFLQFVYHFHREEILHATVVKFTTSP